MYFDGWIPSKSLQYDIELRAELKRFGYNPGPITETTRNVYMKKLEEIKYDNVDKLSGKHKVLKVNVKPSQESCRVKVEKNLLNADWMQNPSSSSEERFGYGCFDGWMPSKSVQYDIDLRAELKRFGYNPGPITETTRNLYMKKLGEIKYDNVDKLIDKHKVLKVNVKPSQESCRVKVEKNLLNADWMQNPSSSSEERFGYGCFDGWMPSKSVQYDIDLRAELKRFGYNPGPITETTRNLYMKKLGEIKYDNVDKLSDKHKVLKVNVKPSQESCRVKVEKNLLNADWMQNPSSSSEERFVYGCFDGWMPSKSVQYDIDLRAELKRFGYNPGPITETTRNLYMKKLGEIKYDNVDKLSGKHKVLKVNVKPSQESCRVKVEKNLLNADWMQNPSPSSEERLVYGCFDRWTPSKSLQYDIDLRAELKRFGYNPGPITETTRNVYMKKLEEIKYDNVDKLSDKHKVLKVNVKPSQESCRVKIEKNLPNADWIQNPSSSSEERFKKKGANACRVEIEKILLNADWMQNLAPFKRLEEEARKDFADPRMSWPCGNAKKSYIYLLLDPGVTKNLPTRVTRQTKNLQWTTFIDSIFYVGKGQNERPYKHLIAAKRLWDKFETSENKKIQYILDIWENHMGVVCLQIFHNLISAEAFTYEAAIIDALGLNNSSNLTNLKSGSYKGVVALWSSAEKRMLGVYLLYKAMLLYLNVGERQLRPRDL